MHRRVGQAISTAIIARDEHAALTDSVAVVSDRRLSVAAVAALLGTAAATVIDTAHGADNVRTLLGRYCPDIVIGDSSWESAGIDPSQWGGRVLLLLDPEEEPQVFVRAVATRVQGYLSHSASEPTLRSAMYSVRDTGYYVDPVLVGRILWASEEAQRNPSTEVQLSERELEVLSAVARGRSSKEIARDYDVTAKTVCNHISNIYAKLNLQHRGQLVLYAAELGLGVREG
ncbi:MAG TPA: response regulator transcription factor [Candidatus Dormibacteraeota bacterium]|jgi:DNA-binding NarL/FixJ family response regulator|nr:response regulator transcription factor [Candidatus Dormibacteraeota bacterium]